MNKTETTSTMTATLTAPVGEWFTALRGDTQADITEMVNEQGYPLDDIRDFVEQYGEEAYVAGHYVTWCELTEQTGADNEAIEAYADVVGISSIGGFEDAYYGEFDSEEEFAEEYYINIMGYQDIERAVERGIVVDWQATWDTNLQHDFAYNNGYVFNTNM
jgi:antirestriction protein